MPQATISPGPSSTSTLLLFSCLRLIVSAPYHNAYLLWQVHQEKESSEESVDLMDAAADGYLIQPAKQLPLDPTLLNTWSNIIYLPTEGLNSPWKGFTTGLLRDTLTFTVEPLLTEIIQTTIPLGYDTHSEPGFSVVAPAIARSLFGDVLFGVLVSPLDILRTRMVCQSAASPTYTGPFQGTHILSNSM